MKVKLTGVEILKEITSKMNVRNQVAVVGVLMLLVVITGEVVEETDKMIKCNPHHLREEAEDVVEVVVEAVVATLVIVPL